jgi:hypothetical protein
MNNYFAIYNLKILIEDVSFKQAFKAIYDEIQKEIEEGQLTYQSLTCCWIKDKNSDLPIMFYDARDIACKKGYLIDGKWAD